MTTKKLSANEVSISAATVDIQMMRVGSKQMTLSVFRQLERDDDITGDLWGRVNYHPDKCGDEKLHLHAIWQKETELRRATIYYPGHVLTKNYIVWSKNQPGAGWLCAAMLEGVRFHPDFWDQHGNDGFLEVPAKNPELRNRVCIDENLWLPAKKYADSIDVPKNYSDYRKKEIEKECRRIAGAKTAEQWKEEIREKLKETQDRFDSAFEEWEKLSNLRQLFIAV